jgi:SAM-dependent methyltransferase
VRRDVNEDAGTYYKGQYWNDLECTNRMINRRISGDEGVDWWRHFSRETGQVFERALVLNCGNGWVERDMLDGGLIKSAVGIDYSEALLAEARTAAADRPLAYQQMNINTAPLPDGPFDLVVNHAAAHHVTRIDRVFRNICDLLPEDGWFISLDYVGPHRNQYSPDAWDQAWNLNRSLPEHLRQSMDYPLLDLWIEVDPTEAVHSELTVETLRRYFRVPEFVPLGGALAYPVLTHNEKLFSESTDPTERERWGQMVLDRDAEYLEDHPDSNLFAYFTAQPNKEILLDQAALEAWERAEELREARAAENGGRYYDRSMLTDVYWALAVNQESARTLLEQVQAIQGSYLYARLTKFLEIPLVRRAMQSKTAGIVRSRLSPPD